MTRTDARPRLVIAGGHGRLGGAIVRGAIARGFPVVAIVSSRPARRDGSRSGPLTIGPSRLPETLRDADVFVSAATPEAEKRNLPRVAERGVPAVVATSGLSSEADHALREASRVVPVVADANFSLGAHILFRVAEALGPLPLGYDLSISETHRREKRDHPSATARALAGALAPSGVSGWNAACGEREPGRVEIASLRGGDVPGRHELLLSGPHEALRFEHWAFGREAFADGVLAAAAWVGRSGARRPPAGLYGLQDVMALSPGGGLP